MVKLLGGQISKENLIQSAGSMMPDKVGDQRQIQGEQLAMVTKVSGSQQIRKGWQLIKKLEHVITI